MTKCDFCNLGNANFCDEYNMGSVRRDACISASNAMKNFLRELYSNNNNIEKGVYVDLANGTDETSFF